MHCRAHLVSMSVWPNNKIAPCCVWDGEPYQDVESMKTDLNQKFSSGNIPTWCQNCTYKDGLTQYIPEKGLQLLDIRNDNICNLKCRSCGPQWSSRWANELGILPIRSEHHYDFKNLDLSNLKSVYYCGGEPFLSNQHTDILNLIPDPLNVKLIYNTNCTTLHYKDQYIPDLWKKFNSVLVNVSIDAIGQAAEVVRSGTDWHQVESIFSQLCEIKNKNKHIGISLTPVLSALNIWWFDQWLEYFDSWQIDQIWPITVNSGNMISLSSIPVALRPPIIKMLEESKFSVKFRPAVDILKKDDSSQLWSNFVNNQIELDLRRNENWHHLLHSSQFWA